jgi:probable addiction module killer protein
LGDHKSVGHGTSEMRVHIGAGYRLYYTVRDRQIIFLLLGGDKSSQKADIAAAQKIKKELFP